MEYPDLTEKIIGCAYKVYNTMGSGFLEAVYERCLAIELEKAGLAAEFHKPVEVYYDNQNVGSYVVDALIEDTMIVELKAVRNLTQAHEVQLVNHLAATGMKVGLLLNFGEHKVDVRRKVLSF